MIAAAMPVTRRLELFPRQRRFVADPARFPAYIGGIGSGKTFAGAAKVIARIGRRERGLVCAPTYQMLRDATRETLLSLLNDLGVRFTLNKSENTIRIPSSGHEILFRSLDKPENMRGPNVAYAWTDEGSLITRLAWRIVIGRVRIGVHPQAWLTGTPKGRNWVWEDWERDADANHPLYRVMTTENPELPPDFATSLGYTGRFAAQELGGEFVAHEGLVYPGFSRSRHVRERETPGWPAVITVDAGVRNPSAILTIRHTGDARHVEREIYRRGMGSDELKATVITEAERAGATLDYIWVDPSAAGLITDLELTGLPVRRANNDVQSGLRVVTTALEDDFSIDPSCVNTIAEFESYSYPEGAGGEPSNSDRPVKANDHAMDSLRYGLMGLAAPKSEVYVL